MYMRLLFIATAILLISFAHIGDDVILFEDNF